MTDTEARDALATALHDGRGGFTCEIHHRAKGERAYSMPCELSAAAILAALDGWTLVPTSVVADAEDVMAERDNLRAANDGLADLVADAQALERLPKDAPWYIDWRPEHREWLVRDDGHRWGTGPTLAAAIDAALGDEP